MKNEHINNIWTYFYDYIFFPRFNNKEKYDKWDKPKPDINKEGLLESFKRMTLVFEDFFEFLD